MSSWPWAVRSRHTVRWGSKPTPPGPAQYAGGSPREINHYTLTGPWDSLFIALLKERCHQDGFEKGDLEDQFRAHINRGVLSLYKQVRDLSDLARLIPKTSVLSQEVPSDGS